MSTAIETAQDGPPLIHPRAQRIPSSTLVPQQTSPKTNGAAINKALQIERQRDRQNTPVPSDAPPSVHATSSARKAIREQTRKRLFPTVDYEARVSYFDPQSDYTNFKGFFVLFWIGLAIMVITASLRLWKETGSPFRFSQREIMLENIWEMAISDAAMTASVLLCLPLHLLYANVGGPFRWGRGGIWIQSAFQVVWLAYWVQWPFLRNWTWTAQVFFTIHLLTLFMKLHSYAFYNGHLSETQRRIKNLNSPRNESKEAAVKYPTTSGLVHEIQADSDSDSENEEKELQRLREELAVELTSPLGNLSYPQNLTVYNFADYLCCPTLCYELEYPRTSGIRPMELFYKTLAVFGCVFLLTVTTETYILPVLADAAIRLQSYGTLANAALIMAETISSLLFPFMVAFLLVFLVIFEYVCGAFAELTCFADRRFYSDWWNSTDWLEFSREWNIPVHNFFRRHVYAALSRPTPHARPGEKARPPTSRPIATFITFLISALAHELLMGCITRKVRGYGFFAMMLQMPIVLVQRSKFVRGRVLLNNVLFWISMITGLSMICSLYVLV